MLNFQFNSVSRPHPLRRGERRETESGDKIRRGWDGMGEKEKVGTDRESKDVCGVCNAFDSVAEMRGVDGERKEKKKERVTCHRNESVSQKKVTASLEASLND
jgi:hypothetical protein